jgi:predicted rRNA methylase YqxC with S4 and FtsJ domains
MTASMTAPTTAHATSAPTVLDRLIEFGITQERARRHLQEGRVYVDDVRVTDPSAPVDRAAHLRLRDYLPA